MPDAQNMYIALQELCRRDPNKGEPNQGICDEVLKRITQLCIMYGPVHVRLSNGYEISANIEKPLLVIKGLCVSRSLDTDYYLGLIKMPRLHKIADNSSESGFEAALVFSRYLNFGNTDNPEESPVLDPANTIVEWDYMALFLPEVNTFPILLNFAWGSKISSTIIKFSPEQMKEIVNAGYEPNIGCEKYIMNALMQGNWPEYCIESGRFVSELQFYAREAAIGLGLIFDAYSIGTNPVRFNTS